MRREPALVYIGLLAPVVQAITAFVLVANPDVAGAVNAGAVAVAGAITAWMVNSDRLVPALTGAAQALIAVVVAFGIDWTTEQQAALMVPLGIVASIIVRDRVTAPVASDGTVNGLA
ncbi:hypothetical protein [Pseudonocardia alni]|uniref:hypothetical protein n=1 Tax=Pseudonocardia alni TaxID=33907 RepID=UPI00332D559B